MAYYLTLLIFVVPIVTSIVLGSEMLAVVGVLSFFLVIRLMFYVSTYFLVFPFGDPYGQFGVLRVFDQTSHISIIFPNIPPFAQSQYLAVLTNQYSQWPGFQVLTLSFSRVTGMPLLESAMAITMILDVGWFTVSYALVRKVLARTIVNLPNAVALSMAIVTALPTTEIPSYFKYDFPATLFLLASVLLLLRVYDNHDFKVMIPLTILSVAITVTHSISSLFWVLLLVPFALWTTVPGLFIALSSKIPFVLGKSIQWPKFTRQPPLYALFVFALLSFFSWSAFYAVYIVKYSSVSTGKILSSFSLGALSGSRLSSNQSHIGSLTPKWILDLLYVRDHVFLGLLLAGLAALILVPALVRRAHLKILLLTVAVITVVTEFSGALNFGDRALLLFAPLIGFFTIAPLTVLGSRWPRLGKAVVVSLMIMLVFAAGVGLWASSYAPTGLYMQGADPSTASGRPVTWPGVASYLSLSGRQDCILTNEIYVTSMSIPVDEWNISKMIGNARPTAGCLVVV
ncbi:MAG TPA: hypothetical protein VKM96_06470, partial [Candidatus Bathyarchaeia archaeon]|nr:hypothetical protein [Candidatus Bathyarchaeia archaeon]